MSRVVPKRGMSVAEIPPARNCSQREGAQTLKSSRFITRVCRDPTHRAELPADFRVTVDDKSMAGTVSNTDRAPFPGGWCPDAGSGGKIVEAKQEIVNVGFSA
jgi:hypothetical protein